ncbi:MAG: hypothetical protein QXW79_01505 [Thermoplasmata archaeon]
MGELLDILLNRREDFVEKLWENYNYNYLVKFLSEISSEHFQAPKICPDDKYVYRYLSGLYENSKYTQSSISWIPSRELVEGILLLAEKFGLKYIEEVYAGLGILSALIKKTNSSIKIVASDNFENPHTCNQLGFVPIAKRSPKDFRYYEVLGEPYPQMIISSYYPCGANNNIIFLEEMSDLLQSNKHDLIIMILPHTFTSIYDMLYHTIINSEYNLYTFHVKAVDKYFFVHNLFKDCYKTGMLAHIVIREKILKDESIEKIFETAIVPSKLLDKCCQQIKYFKVFYDNLSTELIISIYKICDFKKATSKNSKFNEVVENTIYLISAEIRTPVYILEVDEFLFWSNFIIKKQFYFVFRDRIQFYNFYIRTRSEDSRNSIILPHWVNNEDAIYIYVYLDIVNPDRKWKYNYFTFSREWARINKMNKTLLRK